ncbi:TetR family transcriptional regulator [Sorangium cellulosum]|uniref:TetR family transcriptional regulator n=1 Tax=Sorangium cellulosum TaxID=56 RepID=A0A2L0F6X7_SORCE|nr:TetR/AcrR family transcriptional regulator [Sorangium cellulosum]AUX47326.1 TetR family transcriptional regulator [Sorangium cellulosum]
MSSPKKKGRGTYHHGDLRQALVDAALRALEGERAEDLSLRALGRELGVSPRAPYRHFETKEELLAAVAVEGFRAFGALMTQRVAAAGADPIARLRAVAEAYVLFAIERPAAFRVMYAPYATVNESAPDLLRARAEGHQVTMDALAEGQAAGLLREGDPMQLALVLWSSMHGLAVLLTQGQLGRFDRPVEAAKLAGLVSGLVMEGLLPRPDRRP